jgi:hypothetical protein
MTCRGGVVRPVRVPIGAIWHEPEFIGPLDRESPRTRWPRQGRSIRLSGEVSVIGPMNLIIAGTMEGQPSPDEPEPADQRAG